WPFLTVRRKREVTCQTSLFRRTRNYSNDSKFLKDSVISNFVTETFSKLVNTNCSTPKGIKIL
ncbi:hypothetical protein, partial [Bacillus tropicus]|uniref:hypothetical protein n=1 Tax=Bacillus tropicus TaxID=2026188 RepID=UPI003D22D5F6